MTARSKNGAFGRGREPETRPAYPVGFSAIQANGATPVASEQRELTPLEQRVEDLKRDFAGRQWDLGGIAYEMAVRNHFRIEVLRKRGVELQRIDAELGEATRLVSIENASAGGECPGCGSLYGRGAFYCWHCGQPISG